MLIYFIRKSLAFLCSLFVIASLTFFLMKLVPGDPFSEEQTLRRDMQESLQRQYGLDLPWLVQYRDYLHNLLHGRLGYSFKYPGRSVISIIQESFPISARLGIQSFCLTLSFGICLGTFAALKPHLWQDRSILILTTAGLSVPSFILATLLQYSLAIYFPIFPLARWGTFAQTILPSLALSAAPMAFIARLTRTGLLEVLQSDYIKLARAKGLPFRYWLLRHALRNALLPVLSYIGPLLANVLVGSFVIEKIFSIPGLGQWFVNSVSNRDYSLIMGLTLFYSFILLGSVFLVDLLYGIWDPRIRLLRLSKAKSGNS
jgi:oligopeptide transport system permease protein